MRPTETKKFTPIFDFIEIGGEASSDGNGWASEAGGDAVERITLPCGGRFYVRSFVLLKEVLEMRFGTWGIDVGKAVRGK